VDDEKFGYLGTDEERTTRPKKSDFERNVLGGCVVFSLASTIQLAAVAIPLLLERSLHTYEQLHGVLLIYLVAGVIAGVGFTVFAGLAGLCGSLAGLVPSATFLWLRLSDKVSGQVGIEGMEPADYPASYAWLVPLVVCTALGVVFIAAFYIRQIVNRKQVS
jgi:hypothetical protein